jgi:ABC-type phosphate transport system substrate-binding protein
VGQDIKGRGPFFATVGAAKTRYFRKVTGGVPIRTVSAAVLIALFLPVLVRAGDDLAVIANKSNPTDNLTKAQLKKLVMGEQAAWPSGKKVSVVLRSPGQSERTIVLRSVCGMSESEFNEHLMQANFGGETGGGPKSLSSGVAVRQLVMSIPGAIGFIRMSEVDATVKVISVDGVAAGQPGYKVREGN